jgi:transposase-like protein
MMPRSKYPVKFKLAVVQDVLSGQGRAQVARKYDVPVETLKDWLAAFRSGRLGGDATGANELARLRLENMQLKELVTTQAQQIAFLKKLKASSVLAPDELSSPTSGESCPSPKPAR